MENYDGFGEPKLEQLERFRYLQLVSPDPTKGEEKTELIVRLLPPMKSYKDTGKWAFFYGVHYGFKGVNKNKPDSPRARPFGCIEQRDKTKNVIVQHCPQCDRIAKVKALAKPLEDKVKAGTANPTEAAKLRTYNEWLRANNLDKKVYINVMAFDGTFGVLKLSWKAFTSLKTLVASIGIQAAMSLSKAPWIKFTRIGQKLSVQDTVSKYQEVSIVDGEEISKTVFSTLTPEQRTAALQVCPDLTKIVKYITADQIAALVNSSGSPEEVDRIFDGAQEDGDGKQDADGGNEDESPAPAYGADLDDALPAWMGGGETKPTPAPIASDIQVQEEDEEAVMMAKLEAMRAKKAVAAAQAQAVQATTTTDDFLARFRPSK